ncbi:uncharacterized protein LOC122249208 [Penaeus japonicus]|uniref:uncharacterized protein LOC122249208 n=1 Tax=Penaeus japonicus TaxID=27405 RepID=UPI001C716B7B|nr:uncharacterized protein LOC122249208 [Penaeus japonicus]
MNPDLCTAVTMSPTGTLAPPHHVVYGLPASDPDDPMPIPLDLKGISQPPPPPCVGKFDELAILTTLTPSLQPQLISPLSPSTSNWSLYEGKGQSAGHPLTPVTRRRLQETMKQ